MRKILREISLLTTAMVIASLAYAQDWVSMMQDNRVKFTDVQNAFNQYQQAWEQKIEAEKKAGRFMQPAAGEESEVPGFTQYKRWEWMTAPRVDEEGNRPEPWRVYEEMQKYKQLNPAAINGGAGNWKIIGPVGPSGIPGVGRINAVRVHPTNPNILFVCAPSGGLWKTTDGGSSWTTNTDLLDQVIGTSDLAFDPVDPNIMYLATGDLDHGDVYSVGLLKSTDGGNTWKPTGLSLSLANYLLIGKIIVSPNNGNNILVATTGGIYRSTDAGVSFTRVFPGSFKDMEMKPGDPNTYYASGISFARSTDGGATWANAGSGLAASTTLNRMAIAVTAADPTRVYLIAITTAYAVDGFYTSTNSGVSFTKTAAASAMSNFGNQGWYDLALAANPTNAQEIMCGGQTSFYRSQNGGTSWSDVSGSTHVDYHDCVYADGSTVYLTSDGGIWKSTNNGTSWTGIRNGLGIAQMYGFGQSSTNANLTIQGFQDNGTNRCNGGTWANILGGDGMICFVSWGNDQNMWGEAYNGSLQKSTNGGGTFSSCKGNITGTGAWVTPWKEDPITANTIYAGFNDMWKHTSGGGSSGWVKISSFNSTTTISEFAISGKDNQVIWVTDGATLRKTSNGGTSWTTIARGGPGGQLPSGVVTFIACSNTDANRAWVVFSGFNNKNKVFQTNDQGNTWINISAGLPNIPMDCITYVKNSNDALYLGTDVGVYFKDASMSTWEPFNNGLPNVWVSQIEILYSGGNPSKIRASTFGRGLWESDPYVAGSYAPIANFVADKTIACAGLAVQFTDYSSGQPTGWNWSFPGGNPSSSTQKNPKITYNTPGTYPVTLNVSNANGNDSKTFNSFITISTSPYAAPTASGTTYCGPKNITLTATSSGGGGTLRWWDAAGGGNMVATGPSYSIPNAKDTRYFWVDETFPGGTVDYTGEYANSIGTGAFFTANDIRGLYFDVLNPVVLNTVQVYCNSAGNRTIEILDPLGNTYWDTTVYIPAAPTTLQKVTLNATIYPGTNYFIKCRGTVDLYRNDKGAQYPYLSSSVNITESNASLPGYYYYFYQWEYTEIICNTARTQVLAWDSCSTVSIGNVLANSNIQVYPNPSQGIFDLKFNIEAIDNYHVTITNALGQAVYRENLGGFAGAYEKKIDISSFGSGVYLVTITNSNNEAVKKVMVY